jgi:hypothetical protein
MYFRNHFKLFGNDIFENLNINIQQCHNIVTTKIHLKNVLL